MTKPSRAERFRPAELLGLASGFALFTGFVVWGSTRDLRIAAVFLGVSFIVALVLLAMFALAVKPDSAEREDIEEQNRPPGHGTKD